MNEIFRTVFAVKAYKALKVDKAIYSMIVLS